MRDGIGVLLFIFPLLEPWIKSLLTTLKAQIQTYSVVLPPRPRTPARIFSNVFHFPTFSLPNAARKVQMSGGRKRLLGRVSGVREEKAQSTFLERTILKGKKVRRLAFFIVRDGRRGIVYE